MSKDARTLLEALEALRKFKSEMEDDDGEKDNIAHCSIRIEHAKYELSRKMKNRSLFLNLVNLARAVEANIYCFAHLAIDDPEDIKKTIASMKRSCNNLSEQMDELAARLTKNKEDE